MPRASPLLEVCVDSIAGHDAAVAGGADRLELCARLDLDGLSPRKELVEHARVSSNLPKMAMVRPRAGDFVYSGPELTGMVREIEELKSAGVHGVVLGVLRPDSTVDVARTRELVAVARPLSVTFHRAFDTVRDQEAALDALVELGVERVLTSGGMPTAFDGRTRLRALVERAAGRLVVLAGGGVRERNWRELVEASGVTEIHGSQPFRRAPGVGAG